MQCVIERFGAERIGEKRYAEVADGIIESAEQGVLTEENIDLVGKGNEDDTKRYYEPESAVKKCAGSC